MFLITRLMTIRKRPKHRQYLLTVDLDYSKLDTKQCTNEDARSLRGWIVRSHIS